jgi:hypothetical protein
VTDNPSHLGNLSERRHPQPTTFSGGHPGLPGEQLVVEPAIATMVSKAPKPRPRVTTIAEKGSVNPGVDLHATFGSRHVASASGCVECDY